MKAEIEATFLEVNKDNFRSTLKELGARLIRPEILMRRTIFSTGENSFGRVRDEGDRITLSYKRCDELSLSGMKEICLTVNDYNEAVNLYIELGFPIKAEQETLRETWILDNVEIDIDTWPWLPTFVEIEGQSEAAVKLVSQKLGFDMTKALYGSVDEVYKHYYEVTSHEVNQEWHEIKFSDGKVPAWLEAKRLHP